MHPISAFILVLGACSDFVLFLFLYILEEEQSVLLCFIALLNTTLWSACRGGGEGGGIPQLLLISCKTILRSGIALNYETEN